MNDRFIKTLSLLLAMGLHLTLICLGSYHYHAASTNPERANTAAHGLLGQKEKPIKFVYVKNTERSKEPPADPSRVSDVQRRGASPNGGKGTSPDPTSAGNSSVRLLGGAGREGPAPQQRRPPSPAGGLSVPPQPGSQGLQGQGGEGQGSQAPGARGPSAPQPEGVGGGQLRMPPSGSGGITSPGGASSPSRGPSPGTPPQPQGLGVNGQIQQMYMGAMKGGYSNPNASKLNSGQVSFDTSEWDLGPYARKVQERVQTNWRVPEAQEVLRQKGWVSIRFVIHRDGQVTDLAVLRSSGIPSYDQSALNALRSSNPMPALPTQVTVPQISGTFRFYYNMPILQDDE